MAGRRVLIVGGGIAGLAAATALRRAGADVDLVELGTSWTVAGTGIIQQANVVRAMARLGFKEEFLAAGFAVNRQRSYDQRGNLLADIVLPRLAGFDYPAMLGIARGALHQLLLAAATRAGTRISLGVGVEQLREAVGGVHVHCSDGSAQRYDLVIGADGMHSRTRATLFGDRYQPVATGQGAWACLLPRPSALDCLLTMTGPQGNCGACPLGDETMYLYLTSVEPLGASYPQERLPALLRERLEPYGEPMAGWRAAIRDPLDIYFRTLETLLIPEDWYRGHVLLIGDAAHTCVPHLGQGAGLAIEDAVVIAEELARDQSVPQALQRFMDRRRERVQFIAGLAAGLARAELAGEGEADRAAMLHRLFDVTARPI
jgi:2-polyprenyl-6-methoxyphenol hydroxylase-like FAD-dependent oxidoreductase